MPGRARAATIVLALCLALLSLFLWTRTVFVFSDTTPLDWEDLGPVPEASNKYPPQGLEIWNGNLLLSVHWNDTKTVVYELSTETWLPVREFTMPPEAVHTSGLVLDGDTLWGVDYAVDRAYRMDPVASLNTGTAAEVNSFATEISNTSAVTLLEHNGQRLMAISQHTPLATIDLIDYAAALASGSAEDHVIASFRSHPFSQGLTYKDGYLYDACNWLGKNRILKIDAAQAIADGTIKDAVVAIYEAPSKGVEDIIFHEGWLYTSDETSFRLYRTKLPE